MFYSGNLNCFNWLKWLIPIEHDLRSLKMKLSLTVSIGTIVTLNIYISIYIYIYIYIDLQIWIIWSKTLIATQSFMLLAKQSSGNSIEAL